MQGVEFDLEKFVSKNETMPAIGNLKVNARGDELGSGGKIVRKREEVVAEYYEDNPKAKPRKKVSDIENIKETSDNKDKIENSFENSLINKGRKTNENNRKT